ncbi:uncharacterized protein LOC103711657 isoform X2 [Phoenix dactylifera]|nr:uncharacterized protein LOC103711657 isoform X2 [Phoenix dactylifera]
MERSGEKNPLGIRRKLEEDEDEDEAPAGIMTSFCLSSCFESWVGDSLGSGNVTRPPSVQPLNRTKLTPPDVNHAVSGDPIATRSFPVPPSTFSCRFLPSSSAFTSLADRLQTRMPMRRLMEVEPPGPLRYLIGAAIIMVGVVLPLGYMMFRNKRVPSSSSFSKQT